MISRNALWLLAPPIALCGLDFGLTLYGQSGAYWRGDYTAVREGSPSFAHYLAIHPLVAVGAGVLWILIFSAVILLLPEKLALTAAIAIMIGHMVGAASWLFFHLHAYQLCNGLFLGTSALVVIAFKRGQNSDGRSAFDWERTGLPGWMRWLVILVLIVLPVWWFLVPH